MAEPVLRRLVATSGTADAESLRPMRLGRPLRRRLEEFVASGYPNEVCGLLVGREVSRVTRVERVTLARNLAGARRADRYTLDPRDFLEADDAARRDGLEIVGIWHSHPDHPARPSRTDFEAAWEGYTYVILSVGAEGVVGVKAWRLEGLAFLEQPIEEVPS